MICTGMGSRRLPALAVSDDQEARSHVTVRPFAAPQPGRKMVLAWRKTHPRADDHLLPSEFIREHLPSAVKSPRKQAAKK